MRFLVQHETLYRYSAPVRFAPHVLRLNPRAQGVRIIRHTLAITPRPVAMGDIVDAHGNHVTRAVFDDAPSTELRIESRFDLQTLPVPAAPGEAGGLAPLPWCPAPDVVHPSVRAFAASIASQAGHDAGTFVAALTRTLHETIDRHVRFEGDAHTPAATLATRRGACRDIAVLFLAACRSQGIEGRFVSGYQARAQTPDGRYDLHAWAELLLPGQGWAGWDPTHGTRATDGHVALCTGPDQASTMPVEGRFYGPAETSTLDYSVRIATE